MYNRGTVFNARYALSPYTKHTGLVRKGLISALDGAKRPASRADCYLPGERATRIHWIGDFGGLLASLDYKEMRKTS